jgi:hypothetical protein
MRFRRNPEEITDFVSSEDVDEALAEVLGSEEAAGRIRRGVERGMTKAAAMTAAKLAVKTGTKFIPGIGQVMIAVDAVPVAAHLTRRQTGRTVKTIRETGGHLRKGQLGKAAISAAKGYGQLLAGQTKGMAEIGVAALTSRELAESLYSQGEKEELANRRSERTARKAKTNRKPEVVSFEEYVEFRTGPRRYMVEMMSDIIRMREKSLKRLAESDHPMAWMAKYEMIYREARSNPAPWGTGRSKISQTGLTDNITNLLARFGSLSLDQLVGYTHEERIDVLASLQGLIARREIESTTVRGNIHYRLVPRMVANPSWDYESIIPF